MSNLFMNEQENHIEELQQRLLEELSCNYGDDEGDDEIDEDTICQELVSLHWLGGYLCIVAGCIILLCPCSCLYYPGTDVESVAVNISLAFMMFAQAWEQFNFSKRIQVAFDNPTVDLLEKLVFLHTVGGSLTLIMGALLLVCAVAWFQTETPFPLHQPPVGAILLLLGSEQLYAACQIKGAIGYSDDDDDNQAMLQAYKNVEDASSLSVQSTLSTIDENFEFFDDEITIQTLAYHKHTDRIVDWNVMAQ